jgi:hypothetical protein
MLSSSLPAGPTKGSPLRSSCSPGASPMTIQSTSGAWPSDRPAGPAPNTVRVRRSYRGHARQPATACCRAAQSSEAAAEEPPGAIALDGGPAGA